MSGTRPDRISFPHLYAVIDAELLSARSVDPSEHAADLRAAGIKLLQYRNKQDSARNILNDATDLRKLFSPEEGLRLIMNDRADLALLSGYDGVHVGQDDLSPEDARGIVGPEAWVGVSTHSAEQAIEADKTSCDYIAYGPVFPTRTKSNPGPTVGLAGLRAVRALTQKPLVAIGGITRENCRSVLDAGADCVAVISALLPANDSGHGRQSTRDIAEEFLTLLR